MTKLVRGRLTEAMGKPAAELLPQPLLQSLRQLFAPKRIEYLAQVLSPEEMRILPDLRDALIIARIKRKTPDQLRRYDQFVPRDAKQQKTYELTQVRWIQDEEYLLGLRLGRKPTQRELFVDFTERNTGLRFRAFYAMKYPQRMRRKPVVPVPEDIATAR